MFTDPATNVTYAHVFAYAVPIGTELLHKGRWYRKTEDEHAVSLETGKQGVFEGHWGCLIPQEQAEKIWPEFKFLRPLDHTLQNPDPRAETRHKVPADYGGTVIIRGDHIPDGLPRPDTKLLES